MQLHIFQKLAQKIDIQQDEAIAVMQKLISIKALGPQNEGQGEAEKAEFVRSYLRKIGFENIEEYPANDSNVNGGIRPNIIARIPGQNKDRTIWIMSHFDVVPAGDVSKWFTNPYEGVVKDGKIFGRGAEDNNQGIVSSLIMAKAFLEEKIVPCYNIALLFVSDEETGSKYGLNFLVEKHKHLFANEDIFIVPDAGDSTGAMIEVAEKSLLWLKFKTTGLQVHASLPEKGTNAMRAGAYLITALDELYDIFNGRNEVFDPPISTFEPTKKETNVFNINTIPGEDVFYMDCRILPRYPLDSVLDEIKRICSVIEKKFHVKIQIIQEQNEQAAPATSVDAAVVKALKKAIREVYEIKPKAMGIGGGTVAAVFRRAGLDAAVWATIDDTAHQPNEYSVISNIINDSKVFAHVSLQDL